MLSTMSTSVFTHILSKFFWNRYTKSTLMEGWSGMLDNHLSKPTLNCRTVPDMPRSSLGIKLNNLEPL